MNDYIITAICFIGALISVLLLSFSITVVTDNIQDKKFHDRAFGLLNEVSFYYKGVEFKVYSKINFRDIKTMILDVYINDELVATAYELEKIFRNHYYVYMRDRKESEVREIIKKAYDVHIDLYMKKYHSESSSYFEK